MSYTTEGMKARAERYLSDNRHFMPILPKITANLSRGELTFRIGEKHITVNRFAIYAPATPEGDKVFGFEVGEIVRRLYRANNIRVLNEEINRI